MLVEQKLAKTVEEYGRQVSALSPPARRSGDYAELGDYAEPGRKK
jgi:hypothetical protein